MGSQFKGLQFKSSLSKQESHESRSLRLLVSIASIVRTQRAMNFCAQHRSPLLYNPGSHSREWCHKDTVGGSSASLIKIIPTACSGVVSQMTLDLIKSAISLLSRSDYFKELEANNTMTIDISRRVFRADIRANESPAKAPLWQVQEVGLYRQHPIMREDDGCGEFG